MNKRVDHTKCEKCKGWVFPTARIIIDGKPQKFCAFGNHPDYCHDFVGIGETARPRVSHLRCIEKIRERR